MSGTLKAFILLTAALLVCGGGFYINEVISHPQFGFLHAFDSIALEIRQHKGTVDFYFYKVFFILDLMWAPVGLLLVYRWVRSITYDSGPEKVFRAILITISIAALGFDVLENIHYFLFSPDLLGVNSIMWVQPVKTALYAIVILQLLITLYQNHLQGNFQYITGFVKASILSLVVVGVLGALLTQMPQGGTVLVDLFFRPINLLITFAFLNALAMACSHYPDYLQMYIKQPGNIEWHLDAPNKLFRYFGLGYITYTMHQKDVKPLKAEMAQYRQVFRFRVFEQLRKHMGTLFLFTWVFVIIYMYQLYIDYTLPVGYITIVVFFGLVWFAVKLFNAREYWRRHFTNNQQQFLDLAAKQETHQTEGSGGIQAMRAMVPVSIRQYLNATQASFVLLLVSVIITAICAGVKGWHPLTWSFLLLSSIINLIWFVLFRTFRTTFSYYRPAGIFKWIPLYRLGNDLRYVSQFSLMGWLSIALVVYAHIFPSVVNALPLLLAYLYFYYGIIIIPLKHYFYYSSTDDTARFPLTKPIFRSYLPVIVVLIAGWMVFMGQKGNGLHVLHPVAEDSDDVMAFDHYATRLASHLSTSEKPLLLLASYGGGLRANIWTMALLDQMQSTDPEIFQSIGAMSGVSGGFLGIAMYAAISKEVDEREAYESVIERIANHNFLSIDFSYLLGWDLIREQWIKDRFRLPDRAGRSMAEYASIILENNQECSEILDTGFRAYWNSVVATSESNFYPAIIGNTTGTHGRYGVAFSLSTPAFDSIFPGADNILELQDGPERSLGYFDAASTTNRFPIFSPTAQISGKGHYLDGGYFENSGLLSLVNFYTYLKASNNLIDSLTSTNPVTLIQIMNSKGHYVRKLADIAMQNKRILATGEFPAIVETVTSIDILPGAIESKYSQAFSDSSFLRIYLPYPVHLEDVIANLRGIPENPLEVLSLIERSNNTINKTLYSLGYGPWDVVPPPLARVLSKPAVTYMKAMLYHPEIKEILNNLN